MATKNVIGFVYIDQDENQDGSLTRYKRKTAPIGNQEVIKTNGQNS